MMLAVIKFVLNPHKEVFMFTETSFPHVVVFRNRLGKLFIDYDNYITPRDNVMEVFDSLIDALDTFPDAICLIKKRR